MTVLSLFSNLSHFLAMGLLSCTHHPWGPLPIRLAAPADADNYGVGGTDLFAGATVDAIGRPVRQALAI